MNAPEHAVLEERLRDTLPGLQGRMRVAPAGRGANSFRIGFDNRSMLLRTVPANGLPMALQREHRILEALAANGVPAPKPVLYCEDGQDAFLLVDLPEGRVFSNYSLRELAPAQRREVFFAMAETMAHLHRIDWAAAGLADYAAPANFFAREVACLKRRNGSRRRELARVGDWLSAHLPDDDGSAIQHGDFRLGKLIFDPFGTRVLALCGWEQAALGHPLADAAHSCIPWQLGQRAAGIRGLDLAQQGIPSQAEYLTHYRQSGGHAEGLTKFHTVFALFRAALAQSGADRHYNIALAHRAVELIDGADA